MALVRDFPAQPVLAPRPLTIADTGLTCSFLAELVAKFIYGSGLLDQQQLVERSGLAWPVLDSVLNAMRSSATIEVRSPPEDSHLLRYGLTERGRKLALDALMKCGYVGPAPVPLALYEQVVMAQSTHLGLVTAPAMARVFEDVVIRQDVLAQLGPAMHSGRPMLVYGPPGTGKSFIGLRLSGLLGEPVLVPYALAVGNYVVQFFDPAIHHPHSRISSASPDSVVLGAGHDGRFVRCKRPAVITGGELRLDMLELAHDPATHQYFAPLHLKANNGVYMVDDLGRQRFRSSDLLNRWIVPMEKKIDFLSVGSSTRFQVPFDVKLIFSTNLDPTDLADEAFMRRLGYKIRFEMPTLEEFEAIWRQVCRQLSMSFEEKAFRHVVARYRLEDRMMVHCQPRDLLGLVSDRCRYEGLANEMTAERLDWAWDSYFARSD